MFELRPTLATMGGAAVSIQLVTDGPSPIMLTMGLSCPPWQELQEYHLGLAVGCGAMAGAQRRDELSGKSTCPLILLMGRPSGFGNGEALL